jgi:hypothetical protein
LPSDPTSIEARVIYVPQGFQHAGLELATGSRVAQDCRRDLLEAQSNDDAVEVVLDDEMTFWF